MLFSFPISGAFQCNVTLGPASGTMAIPCVFVFRFLSFLFDVVTQSMSQEVKPRGSEQSWREYQTSPVLTCGSVLFASCKCFSKVDVQYVVAYTLNFLPFFSEFDKWVRSSSLNGTDGEPHWPVSMGLQNIWRERLQEGHNRIKGTRL